MHHRSYYLMIGKVALDFGLQLAGSENPWNHQYPGVPGSSSSQVKPNLQKTSLPRNPSFGGLPPTTASFPSFPDIPSLRICCKYIEKGKEFMRFSKTTIWGFSNLRNVFEIRYLAGVMRDDYSKLAGNLEKGQGCGQYI